MKRRPSFRAAIGLCAAAALAACADGQSSPTGVVAPAGTPSLAMQSSDRVDLGTLGGTTSAAHDINAGGQVVGTSTLADGSSRAFSWTQAGGMVALSAQTTHAYGVNAAGQIVGRGVFGGFVRGFVWTPNGTGGGTLKQLPLGLPSSNSGEARDINAAGQIVGFTLVAGRPRAVLWTPDASATLGYRVTALGDLGGGESQALGINDHGTVVGWALHSSGVRRPFRWDPSAANSPTGTLVQIHDRLGEANAINANGQIAGWIITGDESAGSGNRVARWEPGSSQPQTVGTNSYGAASALNGDGSVLAGTRNQEAYAWAPGYDPLPLDAPPGASYVYGMSADGQAVGAAGGRAALWHALVMNRAPLADAGGPYFAAVGDTVVLDARGSSDADGDPLTYTWDIEFPPTFARQLRYGPTVAFPATHQGRYRVWLYTQDDDGRLDTAFTTVLVNTPPVAHIAGPDTIHVQEGTSILLDGSASSDPNGNAITLAWDLGDGSTGTAPKLNKTYYDNGTYTARLVVTDWSRADTATVTVVVSNGAPTAVFAQGAGQEGVQRTLELTGATDPGGPDRASLQYAFDCGGGYGAWGSSATATCPAVPDQDTVAVKAKVRDKDGGESEYTRNQYIANVLPVVTASASSTTVRVGDLVTIASGSSFTDPGADAPWTWFYDWGDGVVTRGGVSTHALPPSGHRYTAPGTYTLQVSVRDDRGFGRAAAITITVNP